MNQIFFNAYYTAILNGEIDHIGDDIRVALLDNGYTFDGSAHTVFNDVIADEASGTGYTSLGQSLTGNVRIVNSGDSPPNVAFDADDVVWAGATITARYGVIYKYTGDPATSPLMWLIDFLEDKTATAGDFTIQWNTDGIAVFQQVT